MKKVFVILMSLYISIAICQSADYNVISTSVSLLKNFTYTPKVGIGNVDVVVMDDNDFSIGSVGNPSLLANDSLVVGMDVSLWGNDPNSISVIVSPLENLSVSYNYYYFSIGETGYEFLLEFEEMFHSIRAAYSFSKFNVGLGGKYFMSMLSETHIARSVVFDMGINCRDYIVQRDGFSIKYDLGADILNLGPKISYSSSEYKDFIPTQLNVGGGISMTKKLKDKFIILAGVVYQADKLLVPTPPEYDSVGNIISGLDPERSVWNALYSSFYDAPDGVKEELQEIYHHYGLEVAVEYKENYQFILKGGGVYEAERKGDRHYKTLGVGVDIYGVKLDYARFLSDNKTLDGMNFLSVGYTRYI